MGTHPIFSLILPCYNEGSSLMGNVYRIHAVLDRMRYPYEIIFVDDASHDGTQGRIARLCQKIPYSRALYHKINTGRGGAVMDGIENARGNIVGYMDIDCEVSPVYIPEIVEMIIRRKADIVVGKRVYRSTASSIIREILSSGYKYIASRTLDTRGVDTESGYKFFRKSKIQPILVHIHNRGWFWDTEIMVHANRAELRIMEVPVLFLRRFDKESSVHVFRDTLDYLVNLVSLKLYSLKKDKK